MPSLLHLAKNRGFRDHDWLKTAHSFSFANYWDPNKMGFGVLRVLNDDTIAAGEGFDLHPHRDMEIITIPLSGSLKHEDNKGHKGVIGPGAVQVMSAGTGIVHSEFNASSDEPVSLFQLWIEPDQRDHDPRYEDKLFPTPSKNEFQLLASPDGRDGSLSIHQQAYISLGEFSADHVKRYALRDSKNGVYAMVVDGEVEIDGKTLGKRDAIGIWETDSIELKTKSATADAPRARILLIEVPMN
jgi:redox-sensitive bicupin YhaK (pirin superfamily)